MWWSRQNYSDPDRLAGDRFRTGTASRIIFWLGCLLVLRTGCAFAYVIESPKIIELVAHQIGRADTLRVNQRVTTYVFDTHTRKEMATELVHYDFPNIFRTDLTEEGLHRFFLVRGDQSLSVVNDQNDPQSESELDLYHYLLLHHRSDAITRFLEAYGIDTTISSLGKYERQIAFVIGAQYPDEDHSQLWVNKETHLPMRWLLAVLSPPSRMDEEPTIERLEFRFSLWQKFDTLYYPMRIDILHNGVLLRENRVDSVEVNITLDPTLMDIEQQKVLYPPVQEQEQEWGEPYEEESTDDIQKTIDNFKKKFE